MKLLTRQTESGSKLSIRGKSLFGPIHKSSRLGLSGVQFRPSGEVKDRTLAQHESPAKVLSSCTGQTHPVISSLSTNASKMFFLNEKKYPKRKKRNEGLGYTLI